MRTRVEKAEVKGEAAKLTSNRGARSAPEMTARMHFYAVRSTGDQLRWADVRRTGKKPDRMVGR
jgi:hypothetical protein